VCFECLCVGGGVSKRVMGEMGTRTTGYQYNVNMFHIVSG